MNGCEMMKCTNYDNDRCTYPGEICKYRGHSNDEYEYSLSEGGESDVTRDQVEHAWEDLNSLIMLN